MSGLVCWLSGLGLGCLNLYLGCLHLAVWTCFGAVLTCQSEGFPLNGIFGPCACLLAGGCGAWRLLARRHRRRRHSSILQVDIQTKVRKIQELLEKSDFEKMIWSIIARLFAENFDARLPGIVI